MKNIIGSKEKMPSLRWLPIDVVAISIKDDLENYIDFNNQHWNLTLYFSITKDVERFSHEQDFRHILRNGYGR